MSALPCSGEACELARESQAFERMHTHANKWRTHTMLAVECRFGMENVLRMLDEAKNVRNMTWNRRKRAAKAM